MLLRLTNYAISCRALEHMHGLLLCFFSFLGVHTFHVAPYALIAFVIILQAAIYIHPGLPHDHGHADSCWFNELKLNRSFGCLTLFWFYNFLVNCSHHHHHCTVCITFMYRSYYLQITGETFFPGNFHKNNEFGDHVVFEELG